MVPSVLTESSPQFDALAPFVIDADDHVSRLYGRVVVALCGGHFAAEQFTKPDERSAFPHAGVTRCRELTLAHKLAPRWKIRSRERRTRFNPAGTRTIARFQRLDRFREAGKQFSSHCTSLSKR